MLDNFEYTFFDKKIANKFKMLIEEKGFSAIIRQKASLSNDNSYTYEVAILENLTDSTVEFFENHYSDLLFGEQASLVEGNTEDGAIADTCGIQIQLQNGEFTTITINPKIMNKILSVLSIKEIQSFLTQVAEDIENPKTSPICQR